MLGSCPVGNGQKAIVHAIHAVCANCITGRIRKMAYLGVHKGCASTTDSRFGVKGL